MEHWTRCHPSTRIAANVLYNEFIRERHHIHMNATKWLTLTEFVKYLGREGKARVEETPKGWFMTLVRQDLEESRREGERSKRRRVEEADALRAERSIRQQIERAGGGEAGVADARAREEEVRELRRGGVGEAAGPGLTLNLGIGAGRAMAAVPRLGIGKSLLSSGRRPDQEGKDGGTEARITAPQARRDPPALGKLQRQEERERERERDRKYRSSRWVCRGIIVKLLAKDLRDAGYYKEKARVLGVEERAGRYVCELEVLRDGAVVRADQAHLETVLPPKGGAARVVNGGYRGEAVELLAVDEARFKALVRISQGTYMDREVWLDYEDVCKSASPGRT